jgi:carboxymethylenebutenolidase
MASNFEYSRPDGKKCPGYLAEPQGGSSGRAVVVIQEWWGLNAQIENVADRLALAGYRALVPDLFRGKIAKDAAEASHLMSSLDFVDAAEQDIAGAVAYLNQRSNKCALIGFCMGGALTLVSAARVHGLSAGACFYGIPPRAVLDPSTLSLPLILHFAELDDWCTPPAVQALESELARSESKFELHRYAAHHAFMNEARPEVYDAKSANLAWQRTLDFFERTLGSA